jgi:tetratricopeptide (TPR) repeat protein
MNAEPPRVPDYELIQRIGGGAYGEVWLGRSTTGALRAIKLVYRHTFEDARPFEREFKGIQHFERISRQHPSQLALFHVGRNEADGYFYYVMELADNAGDRDPRSEVSEALNQPEPTSDFRPPTSDLRPLTSGYTPHTLRHDLKQWGRLPAREVIEIGLALTEALAHLHRHGLVHRDIKPSNIVFVEGRPKLADIGLVTDTGDSRSLVGTEGYLAPEGAGTPAADVYALGMVLYEALTGLDRHQFPNLPADLMGWPDAKTALELNEIILKACAREPAERYPTAESFGEEMAHLRGGGSIRRRRGWAQALRRGKQVVLGAAAVGLLAVALTTIGRWTMGNGASDRSTTSVFVLPFRYVAPAAEPVEETERALWLCGRITDAFIDGLELVPGVGTGPRKSDWLRFDEDEVRRAIVRTNATRYLLTGRVDHTNDLLQLRLRLYPRGSDVPKWDRTFEGTTDEVIALERGGLEQIARMLGRTVDAEACGRIDRVLTNNLEAYRWFLQARRHHLAGTKSEHQKALDCFDRALALDRKYVTAHEGYIELFRELFDSRPPAEVWPVLAERSRKILELDDTSFVAWDRLLDKMIVYERDWETAVAECDRQSKLWPERPLTFSVRYRVLGRTNESRLYHDRLKQSRPVDAVVRRRTLEHLTYGELIWGNYDEAFRFARLYADSFPNNAPMAQYLLGRCFLAARRYREAIDAFMTFPEVWPSPELDGRLGWVYAAIGDRAKALEYVAQLEEREKTGDADPYYVAWIHAALGNADRALELLDRAIDYRSELIVHTEFGGLRTDPAWDKLRDDPRFEALCQKVGMGKDQWPK